MKKIFTLSLLQMLMATMFATEINGILYSLNSREGTAEVSRQPQNIEDADIPSSVMYEGQTYRVTSIGNEAFYGCNTLTSVTIPNSVTSIGEAAFKNCVMLMNINIPNSVSQVGSGDELFPSAANVFDGCNLLKSPLYNDRIFVYMPRSYHGAYSIPEGIEIIVQGAFCGCENLTNITIPNSVTTIHQHAFCWCKGLTNVTLPNGITHLMKAIFGNCSGLTNVTIPNSVIYINEGVFKNCGLTSIAIPNSVKYISSSAFEGCTKLSHVVWNVKNYKDCSSSPFGRNNHITTFVFGNEVKHIPANICSGMRYLVDVTIPDGVMRIGASSFEGCVSLREISIPNSVLLMEHHAFYKSGLTSVAIPDRITEIPEWAFQDCKDLESVTIPNSVTSIGEEAFSGCTGLTSITIPNSVTSIGEGAFNRCTNLTIVIPNSVMKIGKDAFLGANVIDAQSQKSLHTYNSNVGNISVGDLMTFNDGSKGVVFYVDGKGNGLAVSLDAATLKWENVKRERDCHDLSLPNESATYVLTFKLGAQNTKTIIRELGMAMAPAAAWCAQHGDGWYLPSVGELWYLFANNAKQGNKISSAIVLNGGSPFQNEWYWSSTENDNDDVLNVHYSGRISTEEKQEAIMVRAIKAF